MADYAAEMRRSESSEEKEGGSGHPSKFFMQIAARPTKPRRIREICGHPHFETEYLPTCIDRQDAENSSFIGAVSAR
jgi:hypothetical protein